MQEMIDLNDLDFLKNLKPTNRTFDEIIASARKSVIKANGRLYTVEEAIKLTEEAREYYKKKDKNEC